MVESGAVDLATGQPTPAPRTEDQRGAFEYILWQGNNGWTRGWGAEYAIRRLEDLHDGGELDRTLLGYMLAMGKRADDSPRLAAEQVARPAGTNLASTLHRMGEPTRAAEVEAEFAPTRQPAN